MDIDTLEKLKQNKTLNNFLNNDFLILPLDKIITININDDASEEIRLHIDMIKVKGEQ